MRKIAVVVVVVAALVIVFGYAFTRPTTTDTVAAKTIRIGFLPIAASLPLFVAVDQGYFETVGIQVKLYPFKSSNELAIAGTTGRVDVLTTCATNAALDAMVTSDRSLIAFLANGYVKGSGGRKSTDYLIARAGVSISQLKGKTVAFFPGSVSRVFAELILPKFGIQLADIEYVEMAPEEWLPALQSGRIDAVNAVEPAATQILQSGVGEVLIDGFFAEVQPSVPLSAHWFAASVADSDKAAIVNVYKRAVAYIEQNHTAAVAAYRNYTKIPESVFPLIGLNAWRFTTDHSCRESFQEFTKILSTRQAIKGVPKNEAWLWQER